MKTYYIESNTMTKIKVQCIAVFLFALVTDVISIHLLYDKNQSILTLFSFNEEPLAFQVDFTSSGIYLPQQVNQEIHGLSFYIGKHKRNKVDLSKIIQMKGHERLKENLHFDYVKKSIKLGEDQTVKTFGKIGLKPQHNAFLEVIKLVNNAYHIRLDYSHESQDLSVVFEQCTNPIKLPAMMRIQIQSLGKEQDVSLEKISNQFVPNSDFIQRVLGKNQLIFNLTVLEMEQQSVKVSINNHVQRIPLLKLLEPYCRRKGHSTMYHCDLEKVVTQSSKSEYGGILMEFDFSICERGVSIYSNHVQAQQTYFILHHILIFLVVLFGLAYNNDELCIRMIKKLFRKKKSY